MGNAASSATPEVEYPSEDGMGESFLQHLMIELLRPLIERHLREQSRVAFTGANQFVYYKEGDPSVSIAPDLYVIPELSPDACPAIIKTWQTPQSIAFALEVVGLHRLKDDEQSPSKYDVLGVEELIVFDPEATDRTRKRIRWQVYHRDQDGQLGRVTATDSDRVFSEFLGCYLRDVGEQGQRRLRLGTGLRGRELSPTDAELVERERAERERERAERQQLEAELARLRAERDGRDGRG